MSLTKHAPAVAPNEAALRVRRVQRLCMQHGLDGILLVPGLDGRFNAGSHQAMGYLFEGRSNRDTIDVNKLPAELEDAIALVTPSAVLLYTPTTGLPEQLADLLLPVLHSLRTFHPTDAETKDSDALEENKLGCFVQMLRGCKRLGIPCHLAPPAKGSAAFSRVPSAVASANGHAALPLLGGGQLVELERWPLLQAYGLEDVGRSGFFTMNFEVYDAYDALQALYGELDGRAVGVLAAEGAPALCTHWDEALQALGGKAPGSRGSVSERVLLEPLASYFAYGLLRAAEGVEQAVTMPPRAVAGPRSSADSAASESAALTSLGPAPGLPPLHVCVEAADPRSPLRVGRTLFLTRGQLIWDAFADLDEEAEEGYSFAAAAAGPWAASGMGAEGVALMRTYAALVDAARAAMEHFATVEGATPLSAKAEAVEVFARRAEQLGVAAGGAGAGAGGGGPLSGRLRFALWQCDHANRVTAPAVRGSRQLKVLKLSLPDLTARAASGPMAGRPLGGLVYADTFIDLPAAPTPSSAGPEGAKGVSPAPRLLVLTEGVPALVAVPVGGAEEAAAGRALRSLARVVGGGGRSGRAPSARPGSATAAAARDQERRAGAAAAATSQALAARLRALRAPGEAGAAAEGDEVDAEAGLDEDVVGPGEEEGPGPADIPVPVPPAEALGRLLTVGGGEEAVLLTGAASCPALAGTLHCFACGLAFVEAASRAVWVLDLRGGAEGGTEGVQQQHGGGGGVVGCSALEAVTVQRLPLGAGPGAPTLGEAVVFRGVAPACGLPPACHLTPNKHVALALASMSPAARRTLVSEVLPAWAQAVREGGAPATAASGPPSAVSYLKDMAAPNPFPPALHRTHAFAIQSCPASGGTLSDGGPRKAWAALPAADGDVAAALAALDGRELSGPLGAADDGVEALLLPPPADSAAAAAASGPSVTLVLGMPGGDQAAVAAAVAAMLQPSGGGGGGGGAVRVALLPPGPPAALQPSHFASALSAAAAAGGVRHVVLCTTSYVGVREQLGMLAGAVAGGSGGGRWRLAGVVACCSAEGMYQEPGRQSYAPGLLPQLAPGYLDAVVASAGGAAGGESGERAAALTSLIAARLPGVPLLRPARHHLLRARDELLPPPAERTARLAAPAAVAARRAGGPLGGAAATAAAVLGSGSAGGALGPLAAVRVVFEGALDVGRLREELRPLGIPRAEPRAAPPVPLHDTLADAASASGPGLGSGAGALVCAWGCARGAVGASPLAGAAAAPAASAAAARPLAVVELLGSAGAALRAREWALGETSLLTGAPALPTDPSLPGGELLLLGPAAALAPPAALARLVARCTASSPTTASATSTTSTAPSPAERAAIRAARAFDPLADGWCYDGTYYFDAFGDRSAEHPDMDRFVAEWLAERAAAAAQEAASRAAAALAVVGVEGPVVMA